MSHLSGRDRWSTRRIQQRSPLMDDDNVSEISWTSRPSTQEASSTSASRMSTDSGAGSIEDFQRRGSSPLPTTFLDYWDGVRRHTAPPRKTSMAQAPDYSRPNTVHAWDMYPSRNAMSKYTPLPAIGLKTEGGPRKTAPRYCFQENLNEPTADVEDNDNNLFDRSNLSSRQDDREEECGSPQEIEDNMVFRRPVYCHASKLSSRLSSLNVESDADSDFDEESESIAGGASDDDVDVRPRKPVVRSATFTIEDKKKEMEQSPKLLLALRLPDGSRVSGYFTVHDTLRSVCLLATQNMKETLDQYELVTTEIPKRVFTDFSLTLESAGVEDKTLLNLQSC